MSGRRRQARAAHDVAGDVVDAAASALRGEVRPHDRLAAIAAQMRELGVRELRVLLALLVHADRRTGAAWPGQTRLCAWTGIAPRDLRRVVLPRLEEMGLLARALPAHVARAGACASRHAATTYHVAPRVRAGYAAELLAGRAMGPADAAGPGSLAPGLGTPEAEPDRGAEPRAIRGTEPPSIRGPRPPQTRQELVNEPRAHPEASAMRAAMRIVAAAREEMRDIEHEWRDRLAALAARALESGLTVAAVSAALVTARERAEARESRTGLGLCASLGARLADDFSRVLVEAPAPAPRAAPSCASPTHADPDLAAETATA